MATVRKHMLHGISYHFSVRERMGELSEVGKARKFSAVQIGTEEDHGEDIQTFSYHPTFEEANEAAIDAEKEFLDEYGEQLEKEGA
jgi:hypothetical protein